MKLLKSIVILALLLASMSAAASVTLNTPYTLGNTSVGYATCMSYSFDWYSQSMSVTYRFGVPTVSNNKDTAFTVTPGTPVITNTLNLVSGVWNMTLDNGQVLASGTLTPTQIAGAISAFTGPQATLRNFADQFLMGVLPGTQVDTW